MQRAIKEAATHGGMVTGGARVEDGYPDACCVRPALVEMPQQAGPVLEETFAPILYAMRYSSFDEALELHNAVGDYLIPSRII
jgi:aldehyde dehydrogenase (NAD+)